VYAGRPLEQAGDVAPLKNVDLSQLMRRVKFFRNDTADIKDQRMIDQGTLAYLESRINLVITHLRAIQSQWDRMYDRVRKLEDKAEPVNKFPALPSAAGRDEGKHAMTKRFTLEVTMDTAAFDDGRRAELARILNHVSGEAATGIEGGDRPLRDSDGNVVGRYTGMPK
jgi:hypothetical protein